MPIELTEQQQRVLDALGDVPVSVVDPRTSAAYVLIPASEYELFREFMEVRNAPVLLCRLTDAWVVLIAAVLLGCYFVGMQVR